MKQTNLRRLSTISLCATLLLALSSCSLTRHGTMANRAGHGSQSASSTLTTTEEVHYPHHSVNSRQKLLLKEAETWMGTPYLYGGEQKGEGADCSGFVMMTFLNALDYKLPRNSGKQAEFCSPISEHEVRIGDLVFFATGNDSTKVSHVGIIIDEKGTFIHASSTKGVCHSTMTNPYFQRHFLMYGRVPENGK